LSPDHIRNILHSTTMLSMVQVLVQKYPPALTYVDESGNTPLHLAALHGKTEVVNYLIDKGAEVEARWVGHCIMPMYTYVWTHFIGVHIRTYLHLRICE